ncbi:MAG: hypothetical protein VR68_07595 [Peptococcaceae bacterium BRH_c4a]|nr:MAG: hypothetical protein VR68_07595 [Peptococcaceae bacterium BRH_c4a]
MSDLLPFSINSPGDLIDRVYECVTKKKPFALVRIGDGENFLLAQNSIHTAEELIRMYSIVAGEGYSGIAIPNLPARDRLVDAVRKADVVGVLSQTDCYCWYPLTVKIFRYYSFCPPDTCYAFINRQCVSMPVFYELFRHTAILLIGKPMARLRGILEDRYKFTNIRGVLNLRNYRDLDRVINSLPLLNFDLAFISAGANAKIVAAAVKDCGRVAFDLGHAADGIISCDEQGMYTWGPRYASQRTARQAGIGVKKPASLPCVKINPQKRIRI